MVRRPPSMRPPPDPAPPVAPGGHRRQRHGGGGLAAAAGRTPGLRRGGPGRLAPCSLACRAGRGGCCRARHALELCAAAAQRLQGLCRSAVPRTRAVRVCSPAAPPRAGWRHWTMPALLALAGLLRPEGLGVCLPAAAACPAAESTASTAAPCSAPRCCCSQRRCSGRWRICSSRAIRCTLSRARRPRGGARSPHRALAGPWSSCGSCRSAAPARLPGWALRRGRRDLARGLAPAPAPARARSGLGALGFLVLGVLGLPLLQRYLLLPGMLLASLGCRHRDPGRGRHRGALPTQPGPVTVDVPALTGPVLRRVAGAALLLGVIGTGGYLVLKADPLPRWAAGVLREARWQRQATRWCGLRPCKRRLAMAGGPISLPTYRLIPELLLRADLPVGSVVSRARELGGVGQRPTGIALVIVGDRAARERMGWAAGVPRSTNAIPPGFIPIGSSDRSWRPRAAANPGAPAPGARGAGRSSAPRSA